MPAGNSGTVYSPTPVVTVEFCVPIAAFVTVTLAPVIVAPDGSVTVPDTLPRSLCARHIRPVQHSTMNIRLKFKYLSQFLCCAIRPSYRTAIPLTTSQERPLGNSNSLSCKEFFGVI